MIIQPTIRKRPRKIGSASFDKLKILAKYGIISLIRIIEIASEYAVFLTEL